MRIFITSLFTVFLSFMPVVSSAWLGFGLDTSDPKAVAEEFLSLVRERSYTEAVKHVMPSEREIFEDDAFYDELDKLPPIPEKAEAIIKLDGHSAEARFPTWSEKVGFDLQYRKDRWWVTK